MVYKHAVVAAFHIYAQRGEVAAKRGGWRLCILKNSHGNYIVEQRESWKSHGIVVLDFCGNPDRSLHKLLQVSYRRNVDPFQILP